ncbi:hypothetical protein HK405_004797, partial [Cladochytrium tenue]
MSIFQETLRKASLDQYHDNFMAFGIDSLQSLVLLTMQDYAAIGHLKTESDVGSLPAQTHFVRDGTKLSGMSFLPKPNFIAGSIPKPHASSTSLAAEYHLSGSISDKPRAPASFDDYPRREKLQSQPAAQITNSPRSASPPPASAAPAAPVVSTRRDRQPLQSALQPTAVARSSSPPPAPPIAAAVSTGALSGVAPKREKSNHHLLSRQRSSSPPPPAPQPAAVAPAAAAASAAVPVASRTAPAHADSDESDDAADGSAR